MGFFKVAGEWTVMGMCVVKACPLASAKENIGSTYVGDVAKQLLDSGKPGVRALRPFSPQESPLVDEGSRGEARGVSSNPCVSRIASHNGSIRSFGLTKLRAKRTRYVSIAPCRR